MYEPRTKRLRQSVPLTVDDIVKRVDEGCKCAGGKKCFRLLPPDRLLSVRQMTEAIDANPRETNLAGKLDALARHGGAVHAGQMRVGAEQRAGITFDFSVQGVKVCQVFLFAHSCSRDVVKKVSSHIESGCVVTPDHSSKGAVPWNALNPEEASTAATFIQNYADKHGLPQPAAPRGHNGVAPIYFLCFTTKHMIHALYLQAGGCMSKSCFKRVWLKTCADIVIMKPREDECATCSNLQSKISWALTEDERISTTEALRQHANIAINSRDFYRSCIARAKIAEDEDTEVQSYCHVTFDFAQQASISHHGRQVGALYFRVPWRIQIFGVASEGVPEQCNYLVDEHQAIGKDGFKPHGPNAVVSMVHHHLETHTKALISLRLHADNCCGQDKNRAVMAYLSWQTLVGLSDEIQIDFMRVGHTQCFVDAGFGLLKQKYRRGDVDTLAQLATVINDSAHINHAEEFCWEWRSWDSYLKGFFKPIRNSYKRFSFSSSEPGYVEMSEYDTHPDQSFKVLSTPPSQLSRDSLPPVLPHAGLSIERAKYLYEQIRPFCHKESRDITCPAPEISGAAPKPPLQPRNHCVSPGRSVG